MSRLPLRIALREATALPIDGGVITGCLDNTKPADALFARARRDGLASIDRSSRPQLARVTGEVAESLAEIILAEQGYDLVWHITTPGIHGVDLLFASPDNYVLALEVKGTLRPGAIPRFTPSRLRQMSREWLNDPNNPGMADWSLAADDLFAGVMIVDLAWASFRIALSTDFETYAAVSKLEQLRRLTSSARWRN